jgi:hypothetical protein
MKLNRTFFRVGLTLALLAGVSCTASDNGTLTDAPVAQPLEQPSQSHGSLAGGLVGGVGNGVGGVVGGLLDITGLLTCSEQRYDVTYETIGPKGGTIKVGKHVLEIPRGALSKNVRIKAEQLRGSTNSVRFSPEGLRFAKSARLVLSYSNCSSVKPLKRIAYTDDLLRILELPLSQDYPIYRYVTGAINHFSRYAVAF